MTENAEEPTKIRLFIGSISPLLAQSIDELSARFEKYGKPLAPIELHHKPILDSYYGFLNFETTPQQYDAMKKAFAKLKFKGSVISIEKAKLDFHEQWVREQARPNPPPSKDALRRRYGPARRGIDEIPGRLRTTPRRKFRYMTFRIIIGNTKKILKCPRKKLWGFMRDRKLDEVVWQYANGQWKDGNGDVIETVDFRPIATKNIRKVGVNVEDDEKMEEQEEEQERQRNLAILEKMFGGASEDYIPKATLDSKNELDEDIQENEEDDDDDDDMADWETHKNFHKVESLEKPEKEPEQVHVQEEIVQEPEKPNKLDSAEMEIEPAPATKPSTKTLRSLFNPTDGSNQFSLFGGDFAESEDLDNTIVEQLDAEAVRQKKRPAESSSFGTLPTGGISSAERKGLFFGHFESPFLSSQAQAAQLPTLQQFDSEKWESLFYARRSDWAKKFKGRRREALRQIERKNKARRRTAVV